MKKQLTVFLVCFIGLCAFGQKSKQNTLEKSQESSELRKVLGKTNDFIIAYIEPKAFLPNRNKIDLVAFDRQTGNEVARKPLYGKGKRRNNLMDLTKMEIVVRDNKIFLFYKKLSNPTRTHVSGFYAEVLKQDLSELTPVKEILNTKVHLPKKLPFKGNMMIDSKLVHREGKFALIYEFYDLQSKQVSLVANSYDMSLNKGEEKVFQPNLTHRLASITSSHTLMGDYELTESGDVLAKYRIKANDNRVKKSKKRQFKVVHLNLKSGNLSEMVINREDLSFDDLKFVQKDDLVYCVGLFDNLVNEKGVLANGVFYVPFNIGNSKSSPNVGFTEFSPKQLTTMFELNKEAFKKSEKELLQHADKIIMFVDQLEILEDGSLVFIISALFNQMAQGPQSTYPESVKLNLYAVKVNGDFEVEWVNAVPRTISILGSYQEDVQTVRDGNELQIYFSQNTRYSKESDFYPMGLLNLQTGEMSLEDSQTSKKLVDARALNQFHANVRFDVVDGKAYGCAP